MDPSKPGNLKAVLVDDAAFEAYVTGLAESIENKKDRASFVQLAENTRINLLENSMFQINPYETLTLPILRVFYPKLVAKEAVTVSPMDKPESVKAFIKATFQQANSATNYNAPVINTDISQGVAFGTPVAATMPVPSSGYDVLATAGLNSTQAHLERDFEITGVSADGTNFTDVSIVPAVEGTVAGVGGGTQAKLKQDIQQEVGLRKQGDYDIEDIALQGILEGTISPIAGIAGNITGSLAKEGVKEIITKKGR